MVGSIKGFTALVTKENEKIIFTHCFLHRKHLIAKTIRNELKKVMNQVVQIVNYTKCKLLLSSLFTKISKEIKAMFKMFYYTQRFVGS